MSVWFKYAGDKDITPGHPGSASLFNLPSGGGFPAYGTFLFTAYDIVFPVEHGGAYYENVDTLFYPTQTCQVDVKADGAGGQFYDWTTATGAAYFPNLTFICLENLPAAANPIEVPEESGNFYNSGTSAWRNVLSLNADGSVQYTPDTSSTFTYYPYGTYIGTFGDNDYYWVGDGTFYSVTP